MEIVIFAKMRIPFAKKVIRSRFSEDIIRVGHENVLILRENELLGSPSTK